MINKTILLGRDSVENSLAHYGRKGMTWHKNIFGSEFAITDSAEDSAKALDEHEKGARTFIDPRSPEYEKSKDTYGKNKLEGTIETGKLVLKALLTGTRGIDAGTTWSPTGQRMDRVRVGDKYILSKRIPTGWR